MTTAIAKSDRIDTLVRVDREAIDQIDSVISECGMIAAGGTKGIMAMFQMSKGIATLRALITPAMMKDIMPLQGSSLGFRTDKDKDGGYSEDVVKEVMIEGLLKGARPIGNEINIISGRFYPTKEYFTRQLQELPGLTDLVIEFGVPQVTGEKGALVPAKATWIYNGHRDRLVCDVVRDEADKNRIIADNRIAVRINAGQGADAILGKADRKFRARIMSRLTNTTWTDGDVDDTAPLQLATNGNGNGNGHKTSLKEKLSGSVPPETVNAETTTVPAADSAQPAKEQPPFTSAPASQTATASKPAGLNPNEGESVADWHKRIVASIKKSSGVDHLMSIQEAIDDQLTSKFLTNVRHADLVRQLNVRASEINAA